MNVFCTILVVAKERRIVRTRTMALLCNAAVAALVMVGSVHHVPGDYNERNPGVGAAVPVGACTAVEAAAYHNSFERRSVFAGAAHTARVRGTGLTVGVRYGAVTGYRAHEVEGAPHVGGVTAMAGVLLGYRINSTVSAEMLAAGHVTAFGLRAGF